jgi:hypothetical protein
MRHRSRIFHPDDHPTRLMRARELHATSPHHRAKSPIGVDKKRVRDEPHILASAPRTLNARARPNPWEPRNEPRVIRMHVLEEDPLVRRDFRDLLITRRRIKTRRIKPLRQRIVRGAPDRPRAREGPEEIRAWMP